MSSKCYYCEGKIEVDVTCYEFVQRCKTCKRYSVNNNHETITILKLPNKHIDTDKIMENIKMFKNEESRFNYRSV